MRHESDGSSQGGGKRAGSDAGRQAAGNTVFLQHRVGHGLQVRVRSRAIHDANGAVAGAVEVFEDAVTPLVHGRHQLESFGCSDSSTRSAHRKYGGMMVRQAVQALSTEIPFGWLRIGLDGTQDLDRGFGHGVVNAAERLPLLRASTVEWRGDRLRVTMPVGSATAEPGGTMESIGERVATVYEGSLASGSDRSAIAHWISDQGTGNGAERCSP